MYYCNSKPHTGIWIQVIRGGQFSEIRQGGKGGCEGGREVGREGGRRDTAP